MSNNDLERVARGVVATAAGIGLIACTGETQAVTPIVSISTPESTATVPKVPTATEVAATKEVQTKAELGKVVVLGMGGTEVSFGEKIVSESSVTTILTKVGEGKTVFLEAGKSMGLIIQTETGFNVRLGQVPAEVINQGTTYTLTQETSKSGRLVYADKDGHKVYFDASGAFVGLNSAPLTAFSVRDESDGTYTMGLLLSNGEMVLGDKNKVATTDSMIEVTATPDVEMTPFFTVTVPGMATITSTEILSPEATMAPTMTPTETVVVTNENLNQEQLKAIYEKVRKVDMVKDGTSPEWVDSSGWKYVTVYGVVDHVEKAGVEINGDLYDTIQGTMIIRDANGEYHRVKFTTMPDGHIPMEMIFMVPDSDTPGSSLRKVDDVIAKINKNGGIAAGASMSLVSSEISTPPELIEAMKSWGWSEENIKHALEYLKARNSWAEQTRVSKSEIQTIIQTGGTLPVSIWAP